MEHDGKAIQRELAVHGLVPAPHFAQPEFINAATWAGTCRYAVQRSGMDDYEAADAIHISHSYMSKVLKGSAGLFGQRLVAFMRRTGSLAPLQWLANQMGCDVVLREPAKARIAELLAEVARLEGRAA